MDALQQELLERLEQGFDAGYRKSEGKDLSSDSTDWPKRVESLARAAYVEDDIETLTMVERVLFRTSLRWNFLPPSCSVSAEAWNVLSTARLTRVMDDSEVVEPMSYESAKTELERLVHEEGVHSHPLLTMMMDADALHTLQVWARTFFAMTLGFDQRIALAGFRCPEEASRMCLHNLAEEHEDEGHLELRRRFLRRVDVAVDLDQFENDDSLRLEALQLINTRTLLAHLRSPMLNLGCLYVTEANWFPECRQLYPILSKRGHGQHTLQVFADHGELDEHHAEEWLEVIRLSATTEEDLALVVKGAMIEIAHKRRMYDAIMAAHEAAKESK